MAKPRQSNNPPGPPTRLTCVLDMGFYLIAAEGRRPNGFEPASERIGSPLEFPQRAITTWSIDARGHNFGLDPRDGGRGACTGRASTHDVLDKEVQGGPDFDNLFAAERHARAGLAAQLVAEQTGEDFEVRELPLNVISAGHAVISIHGTRRGVSTPVER